MARKRSTPKPVADLSASIPFPDEPPEDLARMLGPAAALMGAIRTRRATLPGSLVVADPDGPNTLSLEPPESEHHLDPRSRKLRIARRCRLTASRGAAKGPKKKGEAVPLLIVEAAFLHEYDVAPAQARPYCREIVRDGLPVIDVPFDVEF